MSVKSVNLLGFCYKLQGDSARGQSPCALNESHAAKSRVRFIFYALCFVDKKIICIFAA
jgi:hypothetical protein